MLNPVADHNNEKRLEILFSEIFRQHENRLYTLALRFTKSDQIAKDIIQEVFLKLWEQRKNIHTINNMEAWLYRVTENKLIDFLRKASADSRLKKVIWEQLQQSPTNPNNTWQQKNTTRSFKKPLTITSPAKLIYQLNKEKGMNYQQIADKLHISKHTVKNQLSTAVQSVRRFLWCKISNCFPSLNFFPTNRNNAFWFVYNRGLSSRHYGRKNALPI